MGHPLNMPILSTLLLPTLPSLEGSSFTCYHLHSFFNITTSEKRPSLTTLSKVAHSNLFLHNISGMFSVYNMLQCKITLLLNSLTCVWSSFLSIENKLHRATVLSFPVRCSHQD